MKEKSFREKLLFTIHPCLYIFYTFKLLPQLRTGRSWDPIWRQLLFSFPPDLSLLNRLRHHSWSLLKSIIYVLKLKEKKDSLNKHRLPVSLNVCSITKHLLNDLVFALLWRFCTMTLCLLKKEIGFAPRWSINFAQRDHTDFSF